MSQDVSIRIIVDGAAGEASVRRLSGEFTSLQNNVAGIERASGAATAGIARVNNAAAEMAAANARATTSTKEMAWALRSVPAQFTDIVTSLQGGQAPMTVFIQQGGQLKDMFGGAGNAARALGGYVASLITPMNVAAAGTVALAVAYYQGSEEAKAFAKSLALTGNAAGVSINQLQNMAGAVAAATGATKGAAAAALAEIAGTGKVTAGVMEQAAAAAIALERTAGTAIADTVQQFAELGKSPVEASRKLNDQYNYLTVAVYQQIKALEDQGRTADAAAVAQAAYASAVQDNADKIKQRLGLLETGWKAVGDGAKIAWDKMVGVGRETPLEEQIAHQVKYLQDLRGGFFAVDTTKAENYLTQLQIQLEKTKKLAFEEGERARIQKEGIAAVDAVGKANEKSLSKQEQMNKALADYRDNIARVKAADPNSMLLDPAKIAKAEKGIREQFTEKPKKLADEYGPLIQAINEKAAAEEAALGTTEKLTAGEKFALKVMTDVRDNTIRLTAAQKQSVAAGLEQYLVAEKKNVAEAELAKQAKASSELIGKMSGEERNRAESLAKSNESLRDEIAMLGLSQDDQADYRAAKLDSAAASDLATASAIDNLKAEWEANGAMPEIIAGYEALADAKRASAQALSEQSSLARQKAAKEVAVKAAEDSAKAWEKFGDQINQSLTDSLYRAFESGESFGEAFAKSLQNTFKTMALKLAIQTTMTTGGNLLNSGINALVGTSSNNGGAGTNYLGLASNASSAYNLANGSYYNAAVSAWNEYAAGSTVGGYTLGYIGAGGSGVTGSVGAGSLAASSGSGGVGLTATGGTTGVTGSVAGYGSATAGTAGTAGAGGSVGSTSAGLSTGAYTGIGLIIAGMLMSSAAWKSGIRADGNWSKGSDPGSWDMAVWDAMYKSTNDITSEDFGKKAGIDAYISGKVATALFGNNIGGSEGFAVLFGSSLSKQISDYLKTATGNNGAPKTNVSTHFIGGATAGIVDTPIANGSTAYAGGQEELARAIFSPAIALAAARFAAADLFDVTLAGHINNRGNSSNQKAASVIQDGETIYSVRSESGKGMGDFNSFANDQIPKLQLAIIAEAMRDSSADYKAVVDLVLGTSTDLTSAIAHLSQYDIGNTLATLFGMADGFDQFKASLNGMTISFADLSTTATAAREAAAAQKTIAEEQLALASGAGDTAAVETLKAQIAALTTAAAEKTADAVARVMNETLAVQSIVEAMGKSLSDVFNETTASRLFSVSESIVNLFGGIDALNTSFNAYYENFYSATEKTDRQWALMQQTFDALDVSMPTTRDGFRDLVDSLDLTTANGQGTFKALMDVQGAFAALTPVMDEAAANAASSEQLSLASKLLNVQGNIAAIREIELTKIDASNRALQKRIWALEDEKDAVSHLEEAVNAVASAQSVIDSFLNEATGNYLSATKDVETAHQRIADIQRQAAVDAYNAAEQTAAAFRAIGKSLRDFVAEAAGTAAQKYEGTLKLALAGDKDAMLALPDAARNAQSAAQQSAATYADYLIAKARISAQVLTVASVSDTSSVNTQTMPASIDQLALAQSELSSAIIRQSEAMQVANQMGAPLVAATSDLMARFAVALDNLDIAKADQAAAQAALDAIRDSLTSVINELQALRTGLLQNLNENFGKLDANADAQISYEEFLSGFKGLATEDTLKALFRETDLNGDGVIGKLEGIISGSLNDTTRLVLALSGMGDGNLTFDQIKAALSPLWPNGTIDALLKGIDSDGDKVISRIEVSNAKLAGLAQGVLGLLENGGISVKDASSALVGAGTAVNTVTPYTPTGSNTSGSTGGASGASGTYIVTPYGSVITDATVALINGWTGTPADAKSILTDYFGTVTPAQFRTTLVDTLGISAPALDYLFGWPSGTSLTWAAQNKLPAFANGGLANGLALVGERGPEIVDFASPGRVYTANQTAGMFGGSEAVIVELRALREENKAQASALVQMHRRLVKLHERWDAQGIPEERMTA